MGEDSILDPLDPRPNRRVRRGVRKRIVIYEATQKLSFRQKLIRLLLVLTVVAVVGLPFFYWKRAALRKFGNEWNAERHLTKARTELAEGHPDVAVRRALTALQLDPGRIDSMRVLLEAARKSGDSRLLLIGINLFQQPDAASEDRVNALAAINDIGDARRFEAFFERLPGDEKSLPGARYELFRHLLTKGERRELAAALTADASLRNERRFRLLLLEALSGMDDPGSQKQWFEVAVELIESARTPEEKNEAWSQLEPQLPEHFTVDQAKFLLNLHKSIPPGARVALSIPFTLGIAASPERRTEVITAAVETLRRNELDVLSLWLMRLGETDAILKSIDEIRAYRSEAAYNTRVRALVAKGLLEEAFSLLQFPPKRVDKMDVLIMQASVAKALGRGYSTIWQAALDEAERDMTENRYLKLARGALAAGEREIAAKSLVAACRHPLGILPPSEEIGWLTSYFIEEDQPVELLAVTRKLMQEESDHPELLNNAIYLTLIMDTDWFESGAQVVGMAEGLVARYPTVDGIRATLALARLLSGRSAEALGTFLPHQREGDGWLRFSDADRAILAMALEADGQVDRARLIVAAIQWDQLLDVESRFYRTRLRSLLEEPKPEKVEREIPAAVPPQPG